jgi:uncharacterized membrane protein
VTSIIALVLGAVAGALAGGAEGVLFGAIAGWLVFRSIRQQRQIDTLTAALEEASAASVELVRKAAAAGGGQATQTAVSPAHGATVATGFATPSDNPATGDTLAGVGADPAGLAAFAPSSTGLAGASVAAALFSSGPATEAPAASVATIAAGAAIADAGAAPPDPFWDTLPGQPTRAPASRPPPSPPPPKDSAGALQRWFFGGNTIVKAGIGILFIGLAFLAKYASENVHVPVEMRLAGIAATALVLLAVGWHLRLRRPDYAQILQGGAVAVLYLTLFVAFRFYGVLDALPVFTLMVLVAAFAAALAVLQDARALAVIGALGGFAAPLLVSTGSGNHVALFSYYLVLDLGIAAVAWHKTWRSLNLVGFLGTFVIATAWGVLRYQPENFASSEAFLVAFFLLFVAIMLMPARRLAGPDGSGNAADTWLERSDRWVSGSLLFGLPTIVFALQYGLVREYDYAVAASALVMAAFYVGLATRLRSQPQLGLAFDASLAIGTIFLSLVIPFAFDARSTAGAWALEGAGLVWLGLRQRRLQPRAFGYVLLALAGFSMVFGWQRHGVPTTWLNAYLLNALMAAGASLAAAYFVQRDGRRVSAASQEGIAEPMLIGAATLWLLAAAALEIDTFVTAPFGLAAWLASASGIAAVYITLCVRLDWRRVGWPVAGHAPLLGVLIFASAASLDGPLQAGGWWAWPLAFAVHAAVLRFVAPRWPESASHVVHAIGVLVLAALGALQGRAITAAWGDAATAWAWLGWLVVPAALLMVLPRPATARLWPVRAMPPAYQSSASAVLAAGLLLWTLIANVASDGSARPLPHVPLLNPLDLGIGVALLGIWLCLVRGAGCFSAVQGRRWPIAVLAGAGFVWLNAILVRTFHHYAGVPYHVDAWAGSLQVQTGITLLWTVTALVLMWGSASRVARAPWMVGAGLLAAVVLKLLLVDLSGSGTVTRIVSFIGVGVLMLLIGYVAPLPAKESGHAPA